MWIYKWHWTHHTGQLSITSLSGLRFYFTLQLIFPCFQMAGTRRSVILQSKVFLLWVSFYLLYRLYRLYLKITTILGVGRFLVRTPQFWSCIALTLIIYVCPVLTFRLYKNITKPSDVEHVSSDFLRFCLIVGSGQVSA